MKITNLQMPQKCPAAGRQRLTCLKQVAEFHLPSAADIDGKEKGFAADHMVCLVAYAAKYDSSIVVTDKNDRKPYRNFEMFLKADDTIEPLLEAGYGFTSTDVRDFMTMTGNKMVVQNHEIESLLVKQYGASVRFWPSDRSYESLTISVDTRHLS